MRSNNLSIVLKQFLVVLLLVFGMVSMAAHGGDIFKCRDAAGRIAFQDSPCHGGSSGKKIGTDPFLATSKATSSTTPAPEAAATTPSTSERPPLAEASEPGGKNFAWRITKGKQHGYLMGSIHFGKKEMYPLPDALLKPFGKSDALVVEANMLEVDPAMLMQMVMSGGMYNDGTTLKQALDKATWNKLTAAVAKLGMPLPMIQAQRPWLASMTMTTFALKKIGLSEELGIDQFFLKQAKQSGKPIRELESAKQQMALLSGLSPAVQLAMLQQTLEDVEGAGDYFDLMLKAWQAGNPHSLDELYIEDIQKSVASRELFRVMITDRNVTMSKGIEKMLKGGCNCFVVVGAGHLGGEKGIISLLQKKGYKTEQL